MFALSIASFRTVLLAFISLASFLVLPAQTPAPATDHRPAAPMTVKPSALPVLGHGTLLWSHPSAWEYTPPRIDVSGRTPWVFRIRGAEGHPTLLVTLMWDGFGTNSMHPDLAELERHLKASASSQFLSSSVEKTVNLKPVENDALKARYVTFTDAALVGKPVPEGESRNATLGTFRTGSLWGNFMLMTNDSDGPEFNAALQIIRSFRSVP